MRKRKGNLCSVTNLRKIRNKYGIKSRKYKNLLRKCRRR